MLAGVHTRRIGIDIGNVLCGGDTDEQPGSATMFGPHILDTLEVVGGVDAVAAPACGGARRVPRQQVRPRSAAEDRAVAGGPRLLRQDRPAREQVHFVRRRPDKGAVAARLRLDGSVDDRLDVLESLPATVRTRVLFGPQPASRPLPAGIVFAPTWTETLARLVARQESAPSRRKRPGAAR